MCASGQENPSSSWPASRSAHKICGNITAIVAVKPTNNAGQPAAEPVEPRAGGTKRNAGEQSTHRTQGRTRVTQALARVRKAAQQRTKEK
jgi:RNA-directed DNA polymerase